MYEWHCFMFFCFMYLLLLIMKLLYKIQYGGKKKKKNINACQCSATAWYQWLYFSLNLSSWQQFTLSILWDVFRHVFIVFWTQFTSLNTTFEPVLSFKNLVYIIWPVNFAMIKFKTHIYVPRLNCLMFCTLWNNVQTTTDFSRCVYLHIFHTMELVFFPLIDSDFSFCW